MHARSVATRGVKTHLDIARNYMDYRCAGGRIVKREAVTGILTPLTPLVLWNHRQYLARRIRRIYLYPHLLDVSLGVDEEGIAVGDHNTAEAAQRSVQLHHLVAGVRQQMEGQPVFGAELLVAVARVNADPQDHRVLGIELAQRVLELVRLDSAAGSHVSRVEVKH